MTIPQQVLDAIREEALKAANEAWFDKTFYHEPYQSPVDWKRGYAICYERLKIAGWEMDRWIPTEERLPDELEWVIVRHNRPNTDAFDTGYVLTREGRKTWNLRWDKHGLPIRYFTHWKPLPSPPDNK